MPRLESDGPQDKSLLLSTYSESRVLDYQGSYRCPVCRHGFIAGLTLMDAFACNFCRHIFTANLVTQTVQVADSSQPMVWHWNGQRWLSGAFQERHVTALIGWVAMAVVVLPPTLVGLSAYTFPPLPGSGWAWFPMAWAGSTLLIHLAMVGWLLAEYYQFSPYVTGKIWIRYGFGRR